MQIKLLALLQHTNIAAFVSKKMIKIYSQMICYAMTIEMLFDEKLSVHLFNHLLSGFELNLESYSWFSCCQLI